VLENNNNFNDMKASLSMILLQWIILYYNRRLRVWKVGVSLKWLDGVSCLSVAWYLKPGLSLDQLQQIWQLHSYTAINCW